MAAYGRRPAYHGTSQATGGNPRQRFSLVLAVSGAVPFAAVCHRLQPRGSIKAPSLRPHRPCRVSRLAADSRTPPPRDSAPHLHRPLQPRAPTPRTRAALARLDKRGPTTERQRDQTPRPTRRTDPRIPPRRSMNRHFETPHALVREPVVLGPTAAAQGVDRNGIRRY